MSVQWKNRISRLATIGIDDFLLHPHAIFIHPYQQQQGLDGVLGYIGWCEPLVVNETTGYLINGAARLLRAAYHGQQTVPVVYVTLSEEEELAQVIAFNFLARASVADRDLPYYEMGGEQLTKVYTGRPSRLDEVIQHALDSKGIAASIVSGLIRLGLIKTDKETVARSVRGGLEGLEAVQKLCQRNGKGLYTFEGSPLRLYGTKEEVTAFAVKHNLKLKRVS